MNSEKFKSRDSTGICNRRTIAEIAEIFSGLLQKFQRCCKNFSEMRPQVNFRERKTGLFTFVCIMEVNFTLFRHRVTLLYQLIFALAIGWGGMAVSKIYKAEAGTEYFAAMLGIILFVLINTIVSVANKSFFRYTVPSYYMYILLVVVLFLSAKFLSGVSIWTLPIYRNMLATVTVFYAIVSILVRTVLFIFEAAERES